MKYLGNDLALKLPHIHAITGCDTTSFTFSVGKVKVVIICMKHRQKISFLNRFEQISTVDYKVSQKVSKSIQSICCAGLEIENLVDSRV